ncbi:MAG: tyrosine-type recombinase/integrase [Sulfurimonas sp.]|nr:tyrosine-type recombinase/integrase [Sulfurimonas sp.]
MKKLRFKNRNGILYFGFGDKFKSSKLKYTQINKNIITSRFKNGALDEELELENTNIPTINVYLEKIMLEKSRTLKHTTLSSYKSSVSRILSCFGEKTVKEIKAIHVKNFLDDIANGGYSRSLINRSRFLLKEIFDLSILNEDIVSNPVSVVRNPKINCVPKEQKPFTLDEIDLILDNAKGHFKNFLGVSFFTGARSGEILALKWSDIDFSTNTISIDKTLSKGLITTPKTQSSIRDVEILPMARKFLEAQRLETGLQDSFIFTKRDKVSHYANNSLFYNTYREILDAVGLQRRSLHNTRHTFASMMLNNQIDPLWVSHTLGHKNLDITLKVYTHYLPKKEKMVIGFLEERYKNGTNGI